MQVYLRLGEKQNFVVRKTVNLVYTSQANIMICLYPLPKWFENPICGCKAEAVFLIDGPIGFPVPICAKCLNSKIPMIKLEEKEDVSFPMTERLVRKLRFEWSVNGDRWYSILGRNLKPNNWKVLFEKIRQIILSEGFITLNVDYKKETREMKVY